MILPPCNSHHICKPAHLHRSVSLCCSPVPKLAITVPSPCPDRPIGLGCHTVGSPSSRRHHIAQATHLPGRPLFPCAPIAQLPVVVISPTPHRSIQLGRQAVINTANHIALRRVRMRKAGEREAGRKQYEEGAMLGEFHGETQNSRRVCHLRRRRQEKSSLRAKFF